jgi:hypothetical protein
MTGINCNLEWLYGLAIPGNGKKVNSEDLGGNGMVCDHGMTRPLLEGWSGLHKQLVEKSQDRKSMNQVMRTKQGGRQVMGVYIAEPVATSLCLLSIRA